MADVARMARLFVSDHDRARGSVPVWSRVVKLVEEAGEAAGAYVRLSGFSRRSGTPEELEDELADVVLGAYIIADELRLDLDAAVERKFQVVMTRGFSDG